MQFTFDTYGEMSMYFDYFNATHNLAWRKTKTGLKKRNLERQELLDVLKIKTSISWSSKRDTSIKYDSVPYIWLGIDTYICQYGPDVDLKIKEKYRLKTERKVMDDQPYKRRKKRISKKLGCRAVAKMIHIIKLPKYRVETNSTLYSRNQAAAKFHTDLKNGDVEKIEMNQMFILYFSDIDQHSGHPILGVENQSRSDEMVKKEKFIMNNAIQTIPAVDRRLKVVLNGSGYPKKESKQNRRHPRTIINVLCEVDSTQRDSDSLQNWISECENTENLIRSTELSEIEQTEEEMEANSGETQLILRRHAIDMFRERTVQLCNEMITTLYDVNDVNALQQCNVQFEAMLHTLRGSQSHRELNLQAIQQKATLPRNIIFSETNTADLKTEIEEACCGQN